MKALAVANSPDAKVLKAPPLVISSINFLNSSRVLAICTARLCWANSASLVNESEPDIAILRAFWASLNLKIKGITLPTCRKPPNCSIISEKRTSRGSSLLSSALSRLIASNGPTNLPLSSNCTLSSLKNSIVLRRWIRVKIVRKPVAIDSALSRVLARTEVNNAINSCTERLASRALCGLAAAAKTPPVRRIALIISSDSTANLEATELIEPKTDSRS